MKLRILSFLFAFSTILMLATNRFGIFSAFENVNAEEEDTVGVQDLKTVGADNARDTFYKGKADADTLSKGKAGTDSLSKDSILRPNPLKVIYPDSLYLDSIHRKDSVQSNSALEDPVEYQAEDSIIFNMKTSRANLFGSSQVHYQDLELTADQIDIGLDSSIVHAHGTPDSTGEVQGKPVFKQGNDEYDPDKISYNFKTRKAFIKNVYTAQGDGFLTSEQSKRDSDGVMYIRGGRYTTCDAKHPHFYLKLTKAKIRPGKNVVFGPAYLVVEDVPLPLAIPYGFFPFTKSYSSGFIMPSYGNESSRGFYLREGGYYFAINDKIDLKVLGEIYTLGSWGLSGLANYKVRYKFSGSAYFSYQYTSIGEKNMPEHTETKSFKFTWSHRQDSKANPSQNFSASVNIASESYERNNLVSMYNPESYTQSTRTSSVSYSKTFSDLGLTLSGTLNLSQNMRDSSVSVTAPTLNISVNRFYPFKRKKALGKERWYEKIAMSYTGTMQNSITTKSNKLFHTNLIKDWRNGMRHSIPISASFSVFKYITVTPSFNFTDRMYTSRIMQSWDTDKQAVVRDTTFGFYNVYNFSMSVSANTKLYGFYRPLPWFGGKKIDAIRHVISPTVSFSYSPDFSKPSFGFYDSYVKTDKDGTVSTVSYSPYSSNVYGTVGTGMTGNVSLDISNNVEMKIKSDRDSTGFRKISLIDELGASLSYNMAAKEKPWSDLSTRLRLKLTKSYTLSVNAVFATYAYSLDKNGRPYVGNETEWSRGRFGRFQGISQNISYTFNNDTFMKLFGLKKSQAKDDDEDEDEYDEDEDVDPEQQNVDPDRKKGTSATKQGNTGLDEDGYMKFSMPWSLTVSYGVTVRENTSGDFNYETMRYPYSLSHTLNFSGNIRISDGWNISFSSGWDFNLHRLSMTTASLSRDLHCANMSCSVVLAPYTSYNFNFQVNASALSDVLRWKKQSSYSSNIDWY